MFSISLQTNISGKELYSQEKKNSGEILLLLLLYRSIAVFRKTWQIGAWSHPAYEQREW